MKLTEPTRFLSKSRKIKILLIEDDENDAYIIKRLLRNPEANRILNIDTECHHTNNVSNGLQALGNQSFDIILTDLGLPDLGEANILDIFRKEKINLPVIVLTGFEDEKFAVETVRKGAQDYLTKTGLSAKILLRTLCYAIERFKLKDRLRMALQEIQTLQGLLPICAKCKNVKDNQGYWQQIEQYIAERTDLHFTHGYCPQCYEEEIENFEREYEKNSG